LEGFASAFPIFSEADWLGMAQASLKGGSLDALASKTSDGIALAPLYGRRTADARATRGAAGPWAVLTRMDHPEAGDANAQAREDLANGADGLQVVFAGAAGAYGHGLGQWDSASLHRAFEGVRFDEGAQFELDLGPGAEDQAKHFAGLIARSGAKAEAVRLSFGLDPLGALARSGRGAPWDAEARRLADFVAALRGEGFGGPFVAADGRAIHAAGGTPAQELAFVLAAGLSYLRALEQSGVSIEAARAEIAFRMAADADQFVTLSKFRALRLLWARVGAACGLAPRAPRVHAESAWRMMSARDPWVNVMRGGMAAFAAGLGGADSVSVLPFTQAIGLPDGLARRLARNTQLIQVRESHLGFVADPAAGAGAFEALTLRLCEKAWALFQEIEAEDGLPSALLSGAWQEKIAQARARLVRDAARMKTPITGVSAHPDLSETAVDVLPATAPKFAFTGDAVVPPLAPMRLSEPFERLRDAADALAAAGARPSVFLATIGSATANARRVGFARELFEAGGLASSTGSGDASAAESAAQFASSGARLACLCGADEAYLAHAESFARALKRAGAAEVWLAGRPGDQESAWRAAGIDGFIFAGCDAIEANAALLRALGGLPSPLAGEGVIAEQ
jgi:methylmalonyl-CoA mutase